MFKKNLKLGMKYQKELMQVHNNTSESRGKSSGNAQDNRSNSNQMILKIYCKPNKTNNANVNKIDIQNNSLNIGGDESDRDDAGNKDSFELKKRKTKTVKFCLEDSQSNHY